MAGGSSAAPSIPRRCSATIAGRRSASCVSTSRTRSSGSRARSSTPTRITARSTTSIRRSARRACSTAARPAAARAPSGTACTARIFRWRRPSKGRAATGAYFSFSARRSDGETMQRLRNLLLTATALMPLALTSAMAGPDGGVVVGGAAAINNPGTANVTVNQHTDKAIINWRMFDIGAGERATFVQPNANAIALNRVTGGLGPTQILGALDANGRVFVVNRDGIIFGPGAVITTAGFLATTSDIRNEDFMAGRFNFNIPGRPDASIVNMGTITATNGGFAALVAPGVRNSGTITANLGSVVLGAGNLFTLDFYGDKLITLGIGDQVAGNVKDVATGQTLKSLITNEGKLKANGGRVELSAAAARTVVDSVINTSGVIEANSIGMRNGQ